jgi:hypothetical protein
MGKLLFFLENTGEMCFFAKRRRRRREREKKRDENPTNTHQHKIRIKFERIKRFKWI